MDTYNYDSFGQCEIAAPDFRSVTKIGAKAPKFVLADLDGNRVSLADFREKNHVVLEFGSIT
jgi:peroxiredoxin